MFVGASAGSTATLTASTTPAAVTLATPSINQGGFWTSSAPTRLTIPTSAAGYYRITGAVHILGRGGTPGTYVNGAIYVNGTDNHDGFSAIPPVYGLATSLFDAHLTAGSYVELYVSSDESGLTYGGNLTLERLGS